MGVATGLFEWYAEWPTTSELGCVNDVDDPIPKS